MPQIVPAPTSAPTQQVRLARYLSAAMRRAETLFDDGYTAKPFTMDGTGNDFPDLFIVTKPAPVGEPDFSDAVPVCYAVKYSPDYHACTCPAFEQWGECKHHLAVAREVEQQAAFETQCEREEEANDFYADAAAHNALVADYFDEAFPAY